MNNHPLNYSFDMDSILSAKNKPFMIYDGWSILNQRQIESNPFACYATSGYLTRSDC